MDILKKLISYAEDDDLSLRLGGSMRACEEELQPVLMDAADEIERLRFLTTWQLIETAPKDGTWFLAWYPKDDPADEFGDFVEMTNWEPAPHKLNADSWTIGGIDPSHWLPLPTPPES